MRTAPKMNDYGYGRKGERSKGEEYTSEEQDRRTAFQRLDSIQDPGKRYLLRECIGSGVCGDVFEAIDRQAGEYRFVLIEPPFRATVRDFTGNKKVAVKVQKLTPESQVLIIEEYKVLRDVSNHPNLPEFYGIYRKRSGKKTEYDQIWFVMEVSGRETKIIF